MLSFLQAAIDYLLNMHPALSIMIISFFISLIVTFAIKIFTDQNLMKELRGELKELQAKMKEARNNPKKLSKINTRFMEVNSKYMSQSMRPTMFTFIPILLIFGWLQTHIGYYPLLPGEPFNVTIAFDKNIDNKIEFYTNPEDVLTVLGSIKKENYFTYTLEGGPGEVSLFFKYNNMIYEKKVIITLDRVYEAPEKSLKIKKFLFSSYDENNAEKIVVSNERVVPFSDVPIIKEIPWISTWGWFGAYMFFTLIFSMTLRKILNIH